MEVAMTNKVKVIEDTIAYLESCIYKDVADIIEDMEMLKKEIIMLEGVVS